MSEKVKMYTLSELKKIGFNDKLIAILLPEPLLKTNPFYKCAAPMKLWEKKVVEEAMENELFKAHIIKREKRISGAKKAVLTKKNKLMEYVTEKIDQISVIVISKKMLKNDAIFFAIERRNYFYDYEDYEYYHFDPPKETVERWMVNHVRHNLTAYDEELYEMKGKVGISEAYVLYKRKVLEAIAVAYPYLTEEVERQINRIIKP